MFQPSQRSATTERSLAVEERLALLSLSNELRSTPLDYHAERYLRDFFRLDLNGPVTRQQVFETLNDTYSFASDTGTFTSGANIFHLLATIQYPISSRTNPNLIPALLTCGLFSHINAECESTFHSKTPLILALENDLGGYARELLKNGADPTISSSNTSAKSLAANIGDPKLVRAIEDYTANAVPSAQKLAKQTQDELDELILQVLLGHDDVEFPVKPAREPIQLIKQQANHSEPPLIRAPEKVKATVHDDATVSKNRQIEIWERLLASRPSLKETSKALEKSDLMQLTFPGGLTILGEALRNGETDLASHIHSLGCTTLTTRTQATYQIPEKPEPISEKALTEVIMERIQSASSSQLVSDACAYFSQVPSPYQLYLFLRSGDELKSEHPNERGLSVFQIASNLLYVDQENRAITSLLEHAPAGDALARHRNESDFLLLLNQNPEANNASQAGLSMLESLGISQYGSSRSSRSRHEAPASQIHWTLSRIGSLNYSFARLRFDAMSTKLKEVDGGEQKLQQSLLVGFGGQCISNSDAQQRSVIQRFGTQSYGTQFFFAPGTIKGAYSYFNFNSPEPEEAVRRVDPQTTISLRQGYYLVSNPDHGSLIIRNSSPEFGRMLLADSSIYIYPEVTEQLSADDLKFPSQQLLNAGKNPIQIKGSDAVENINFLLDELQGALQLYRNWKFDTTSTGAWQDLFEMGEKQLVGAHLSPGFGEFVKHLKAIYEYHRDSPDISLALAFVHPDFPSWRQFSFTAPDGSERRTLPVDDELIRCLEHLATGNGDERELQATGFRNFVQEAGLDKQGELMIMSY